MSIEETSPQFEYSLSLERLLSPSQPHSSSILPEIQHENPEVEYRQYQIDCLDRIDEARLNGVTKALVNMATGLGKTTVVATDVRRYLSETPGARVLFLCHQKEILRQARSRFEAIVGTDGISYGEFTGEAKDIHEVSCLFASFQTMAARRQTFDREEFDYIVVDESHHGKADTYEPTLNYFLPKFMLGLTATPDRADLQNIRDIFGPEIYSLNLAEALTSGYLARPDYRVILDDIQKGTLPKDSISLREINRTIFIPKRDQEIASIIREKMSGIPSPRVIVFSPSIEHADIMAEHLEGFKALHSKLKPRERDQILLEFRNGNLKGVITIDMFNEGVDIPEANVVVFLRSTQSETVFMQQLGRGLRKIPGKEDVLILDFVANCDRLLMIEGLLSSLNLLGKNPSNAKEVAVKDPCDFGYPEGEEKQEELSSNYSFSFSESSREILELIKKVRASMGNSLPEGWTSINKFAKAHQVSHYLIYQALEAEGITPPVFYIGTTEAIGLSPEVQKQISSREEFTTDAAPEGWLSVSGLSKFLGCNWTLARRLVNETGETLPRRKFGPTIAEAISPELLEKIKSKYESMDTNIQEGWMTIAEYSSVIGRSPTTVRKEMQLRGLDIQKRRSASGSLIQVISPEQQAEISTIASNLENEWQPLTLTAKTMGIGPGALEALCKKEGVQFEFRQHKGKETIGILESDLARLQQHPDYLTEKAPDGWKTASAFSKIVKASPQTIRKIIREHDMQTEKYKFGPKIADGISPEDQEKIALLLAKK